VSEEDTPEPAPKPRKKRAPQKPSGGKRGRGQGCLRKDGKPRESNTGTRKPVVDDSGWRVKAQRKTRIKFDDVAKKRYLDALAETGRKWFAEQAAGVARSTVETHLENDPEFADAFEDAIASYSAPRLVQIEKEAIEGHEDKHYDAEGKLVRERRVYETRLREMFLKKHDPGYKEKSEVDVNARGGCVILQGVLTDEDFERKAAEHDRTQAKNQSGAAPEEPSGE
jgi:hypothetical protein